ncbi:hypothetical protein A2572_00625 [Candidatus Collierbacteria bacterium RIFOXYD1_FULL_40_9]|uniref:DNA polymerase III delta N-terminal domain-containing protein n=1 Tax=Candidatus Collierbacteria bacterium RIFOXYD1_FULL_40_9 TaxID=1817731 RepID=A0A1F5FWM6_9BACT|nr:MAG: hypothetical protein A2572_00625 [Candidatus Collierbacteria bacterium RIFOXYD1_FULL_40_9]
MLPKIITDWQKSTDDFILEYGLKQSEVLVANGDGMAINDLREWLNFCGNLTSASERYVILIDNLDSLSLESQSILLKPLEEKNDKTEIYLLAKNENKILSTILSRCELMSAKRVETVARYWTEMVSLWKRGPGTIVDYCEKFPVDELNNFLVEVTTRLNLEISKGVTEKRIRIINRFLETMQELAVGNVNKRLALENLLFSTWRMIKTRQQ